MNNIVRFFLILIIGSFSIINGYAKPTPPSPDAKTAATLAPPVGPGLPIDENILVITLLSIVFGIYIIYKYQLKTPKAPI